MNQGAIRETFEETGLLVEPGEIVGLYTRLEAAVVTIVFEARIVGGVAAPTPRRPRSGLCRRRDPWDKIAFRTTFWAFSDWLRLRRPTSSRGHRTRIAY